MWCPPDWRRYRRGDRRWPRSGRGDPDRGRKRERCSACVTVPWKLDHVQFDDGAPLGKAIVAEAGQVDAAIGAIRNHLGGRPAGGRRLLKPMAAETVGEKEIRDIRMGPQNRVLVNRIVVVVACPGAGELNAFEGGNALGKGRPDRFLEQVVVNVEIQA